MKFDQEEFNQFVLDNNVIGFFEEQKTLKSGISKLGSCSATLFNLLERAK